MENKVSIVIPVYNCEMYLERCVDSVRNQTHQNFELILVNDGSKDNSAAIILKYMELDRRIIGVFQENQGPSVARNEGMKRATGEFLMFIDSDDYIDNDYVEEYLAAMTKHNSDIVLGGYTKVVGSKVDHIRRLTSADFSKYIVVGPYAKMYRLSFLRQNGIEFPKNLADEDLYFSMEIIRKTKSISYIPNIGYYYYANPNSITSSLYKGFSPRIDFVARLDIINKNEIVDKDLHSYFLLRHTIWYLLNAGKMTSSKTFMEEYCKYFQWFGSNIPDYAKNKHIRLFGPAGEQKQVGLIVYIFMLLHKFKLVGLFAHMYCKG